MNNEYYIHSLARKGEQHKVYCEDFVVMYQSGNYLFAAVFDGCSSGIDSHFASAVFGKALKNAIRQNLSTPSLSSILFNMFTTVQQIQAIFNLSQHELLSTVLVGQFNLDNNTGEIFVMGDGYVKINGVVYNIEQNNRPDYPAYYLSEIKTIESLESYLLAHSKHLTIESIEDVCISTDGILSFESINTAITNDTPDPVLLLSSDTNMLSNKSMLSRKYNLLRNKYNFLNADDIGIIRISRRQDA